jgi:hypothetical protein
MCSRLVPHRFPLGHELFDLCFGLFLRSSLFGVDVNTIQERFGDLDRMEQTIFSTASNRIKIAFFRFLVVGERVTEMGSRDSSLCQAISLDVIEYSAYSSNSSSLLDVAFSKWVFVG